MRTQMKNETWLCWGHLVVFQKHTDRGFSYSWNRHSLARWFLGVCVIRWVLKTERWYTSDWLLSLSSHSEFHIYYFMRCFFFFLILSCAEALWIWVLVFWQFLMLWVKSFLLHTSHPPPEPPLWAMGTPYIIVINLKHSLFLHDSWYWT